MIQLVCQEPERHAHLAAFQDGVQMAFEALAAGDPIPWKSRRRDQVLTDEQRNKPNVQDLFASLHEVNVEGALLIGDQKKMEDVIIAVDSKYRSIPEGDREACKTVIEKVLSYEMFQSGHCWVVEDGAIDKQEAAWRGCQYILKLGVTVCPYCNAAILPRDLTICFDHYLPKDQFPYLRLCLYNLVPVCGACNWPRKNFPVDDFTSYAYPYRDSVHDETRFSLEQFPVGQMPADGDVPLLLDKRTPTDSDRCKHWLEKMKIPELYSSSYGDHIRWISENSDYFRKEYRNVLASQLGRQGMEAEYRRYFKCSLDRQKINVEPLSKLTIDLVESFNPEMVRE